MTLQRLVTALHHHFDVRVPLRDLAAAATIREQVDLVDRGVGHRDPAPTFLMVDDAARARAVVPCWDSRPLKGLAAVLLTGATGFVGSQLLAELLERTDATIWCLVRADGAGRTPQGG